MSWQQKQMPEIFHKKVKKESIKNTRKYGKVPESTRNEETGERKEADAEKCGT